MKTSHTPPGHGADAEADNTVPADFPVPDEVLDLIDEAAAMADFEPDEHGFADEHVQNAYAGRFAACRDLARRLCTLVHESGQASASPLARWYILERYRTALTSSGWTSPEEAYWVTHRMALWLDWSDAVSRAKGKLH
jgi:hypothetical protein